MSNFLDKWNKAKFNVYDSEEKTVLKLLTNLSNFIGELAKSVDSKTDLNGDHKGSWQGLNRPTLSEEGMRATVEKLNAELPKLENDVTSLLSQQTSITPNEDINIAIKKAIENNIRTVTLKPKLYTVTETILMPSNFTLKGHKGSTIIEMKGKNIPIIKSDDSVQGNTNIEDLIIVGDKTLVNNNGIVLKDYYSNIKNVEVKNCGGYGILLTCEGVTGTLVENVLENIIVRDCGKESLYIEGQGKITDGILNNFISHGSGTNGALIIWSSAGWTINNVHTYGHELHDEPIAICDGYNTNISNIYIEDYGLKGLFLARVQENVNLTNINFKSSAKSKSCIYISKSSAFNYKATVNINNVSLSHSYPQQITLIDSDGSWIDGNITNISVTGDSENIVTVKNNIAENISVIKAINLTQKLNGTNILNYGEHELSLMKTYKFDGTLSKSFLFKLPSFNDYEKIILDVDIMGEKWDNQGHVLGYSSKIFVSNKVNGGYVIREWLNKESIGFTVQPSYVIENGNLKVTFSAADEGVQGIIKIRY